jgi:hypothetical protein
VVRRPEGRVVVVVPEETPQVAGARVTVQQYLDGRVVVTPTQPARVDAPAAVVTAVAVEPRRCIRPLGKPLAGR